MMKMKNNFKSRVVLWAMAASVAAASLGILASSTSAAEQKHTPFVTVLLRDWDKWDTNHDGELSVAEIDKAVLDPNVKGDDAAVAGTLKLMSRSKKITVPRLTREYFAEYDKEALAHPVKATTAAAESATTDTGASQNPTVQVTGAQKPIKWDLYFIAGKGRIAKGGGAWPTSFNLDHAHQGQLGDCYLIATIGSMVVHNPSEVEQLVKPAGDAGYRVTLPGVSPFAIQPLTDSQLVISSTTTGQGEWLAVIEQAVGKYNEKVKGIADDEGTDTIANGGQLDAAMTMLTGHKCLKIRLRTTIAHREMDESKTLPLLRKELISAIHDNRVITAAVTPPILPSTTQPTAASPTTKPGVMVLTADMLPKIPPNINTKHAYAILGFDADTDMIQVWNPHGQNFTPKGPDSLQNGYKTEHGKFHIPLKDAYTFFTSFVFEETSPATQPVAQGGTASHPS